MAQDMISTRIDLDRETDTIMRKIKFAEDRRSKRETIAVVIKRVARAWIDNPQDMRDHGIVKD